MKKIILSLSVGFLIFAVTESKAQSALCGCPEQKLLRWRYNMESEAIAIAGAKNDAIQAGCNNPKVLTSNSIRGYGAVVIGNTTTGLIAIGYSSGQGSAEKALNIASDGCLSNGGIDCIVLDYWNDANKTMTY